MYDEVMQLIALAKNDEQYFKRIEDLKQRQLELAHVMEIAKTLNEADMHMAKAKQEAEIIIKEAEQEAVEIKNTATSIIAENKGVLEKNKAKALELRKNDDILIAKIAESDKLKKELEVTIQEHRKLTADRTVEQEEARKVKLEFTEKLKKIREIAAQ